MTVVSGARNAEQLTSNIAWFEQHIPQELREDVIILA